jgi:hypothetical protein
VSLAVSLAAVVLGVTGMAQARTAKAQAHAAKAQAYADQVGLAADKAGLAAVDQRIASGLSGIKAQLKAAPDQATVQRISRELESYSNCIPELQSEINGLNITSYDYDNGSTQDNFYINNPTIVSRDCQAVLYGSTSAG